MSGDPRVMARDLSAGYGGPPALSGVTFAAEAGRSVCVLGPNGGGKTTLFRVLLGEIDPDAGEAGWRAGRPTWRNPSARASTSP